MAKLILKVNYYKPGRSKSMGGYAKYIATRENVEKNEDKVLHLKSTESQQELIEKLLRDFPESIHSEEYQAYCSDGTRENASEYITRTLEDNIPQIIDSPTYADYISTMPTIFQPVREPNASVLTGCFLREMNRLSFSRYLKNRTNTRVMCG